MSSRDPRDNNFMRWFLWLLILIVIIVMMSLSRSRANGGELEQPPGVTVQPTNTYPPMPPNLTLYPTNTLPQYPPGFTPVPTMVPPPLTITTTWPTWGPPGPEAQTRPAPTLTSPPFEATVVSTSTPVNIPIPEGVCIDASGLVVGKVYVLQNIGGVLVFVEVEIK